MIAEVVPGSKAKWEASARRNDVRDVTIVRACSDMDGECVIVTGTSGVERHAHRRDLTPA